MELAATERRHESRFLFAERHGEKLGLAELGEAEAEADGFSLNSRKCELTFGLSRAMESERCIQLGSCSVNVSSDTKARAETKWSNVGQTFSDDLPSASRYLDLKPCLLRLPSSQLKRLFDSVMMAQDPSFELNINVSGWEIRNVESIRQFSLCFGHCLKRLDISHSNLDARFVQASFQRFFQLTTLNLSHCTGLQPSAFADLVRSCADTLTELDLSHCSQLKDEAIFALTGDIGISAPFCGRLTTLTVDHCQHLTDKAFSSLARKCRKMKRLSLKHCSLVSDKSVTSIVHCCHSLKVLSLQGCLKLTDKALHAIGEQLVLRKLQVLDISRCFRVTDLGIENLTQLLRRHSRQYSCLRQLNLSGCYEITERGLCLLFQRHPQLLVLSVTGCDKLTQTGLESILQGVKHLKLSDEFTGFIPVAKSTEQRLSALTARSLNRASKLIAVVVQGRRRKQYRCREIETQRMQQAASVLHQFFRTALEQGRRDGILRQAKKTFQALKLHWKVCHLLEQKRATEAIKHRRKLQGGAQHVVSLQAFWRGYRARKIVLSNQLLMHHLQKARTRIRLERRLPRLQLRIRDIYQAGLVKALNKELEKRLEVKHNAALLIQCSFRQRRARRKRDWKVHLRMVERASKSRLAGRLQRSWRGWAARRSLFLLKLQAFLHESYREMKIVDVQCWWRQVLSQAHYGKLQRTQQMERAAATTLQKICRGRRVPHWRLLRFGKIKRQIQARKACRDARALKSVALKLNLRVHNFAVGTEAQEDQEYHDDWQEYWSEPLSQYLYFSPSRGETSLHRSLSFEFERSLLAKTIKFRFRGQKQFYEGLVQKFSAKNQCHQVEFHSEDLGTLWIDLEKEKHYVHVQVDAPSRRLPLGSWKLYTTCAEESRFAEQQRKTKEKALLLQAFADQASSMEAKATEEQLNTGYTWSESYEETAAAYYSYYLNV